MASAVHVSLNVSDLEKAVEFYRGLFGEPRKLRSDYAKFVSADPEVHLALQPGRTKAGPEGALSHFGIRVETTEEVQRRRRDLEARGLVCEEEERRECCYALQEKFWLTDPDGNRWEVYAVLEDVEEKVASAKACCAR